MDEIEIDKLKQINNYLDCVAYSTGENILYKSKYNCSYSHKMILHFIGIGKQDDMIKLLNNFFENNIEKDYIIGYLNKSKPIYTVNELEFTLIQLKDFYTYNSNDLYWWQCFGDNCNPCLPQWFLNTKCGFHKPALDSFVDLLTSYINGRKYCIYKMQAKKDILMCNTWICNGCFYAIIQIKKDENQYEYYLLDCYAWG